MRHNKPHIICVANKKLLVIHWTDDWQPVLISIVEVSVKLFLFAGIDATTS